jgi:hypothetical protein
MSLEGRLPRSARGGSDLACIGKVRFSPHDQHRAKEIAQRMSQRKRTKITAFRCPYCEGWHVGSDLR